MYGYGIQQQTIPNNFNYSTSVWNNSPLDPNDKSPYFGIGVQQQALNNNPAFPVATNLQNDRFNFGSFINGIEFKDLAAGLNAIGSIMGAVNAGRNYKLAKDSLAFQKDSWNKNYANSVKSYNTALSDKYRSRGSQETGNVNAYIDEYNANRL